MKKAGELANGPTLCTVGGNSRAGEADYHTLHCSTSDSLPAFRVYISLAEMFSDHCSYNSANLTLSPRNTPIWRDCTFASSFKRRQPLESAHEIVIYIGPETNSPPIYQYDKIKGRGWERTKCGPPPQLLLMAILCVVSCMTWIHCVSFSTLVKFSTKVRTTLL